MQDRKQHRTGQRETLYGRQPVLEVLRAGRRDVFRLLVLDSSRPSADMDELIDVAEQRGVAPVRVSPGRIEELAVQGHWQAVARNSLREALYDAHRGLAERVLRETRERDPARAVEGWRRRHAAATDHARGIVDDIRAQPAAADFASLSVALQALRRLADAGR